MNTNTRNYHTTDEDAHLIAGEVAKYGHSEGWITGSNEEFQTALEVEKRLARFNIGYLDSKRGMWGYRQGGSRHFNALKLSSFVKNKVRSALNAIKK